MTTSENVEFNIEVITKGVEELEKLTKQLKNLTAEKKANTDTSKKQSNTLVGINNAFKKFAAPVREIGSLFNKLNPSVLAASFGLGGVALAVKQLNSGFDEQLARGTTVAGMFNQFSAELWSFDEVQAKLKTEAEELTLGVTDLEKAYAHMMPVIRDVGTATSILKVADEVRRVTNRDLLETVQALTTAYAEGAPVVDEHGSNLLLNMEAVHKLAEEWKKGGRDIAETKSTVDDAFGAFWDNFMRNLNEGVGGATTGFKLMMLKIFDPESVTPDMEEGYQAWLTTFTEQIGAGIGMLLTDIMPGIIGQIIDTMLGSLGESLSSKITGLWDDFKGDWTSIFDIPGLVKETFLDIGNPVDFIKETLLTVPTKMWDAVFENWDTDFIAKWVGEVTKWMNPTHIMTAVYGAFESVGQWIWDKLKEGWDNTISPMWDTVLGALFFAENIKTRIGDAFGDVGLWIWNKLNAGFIFVKNLLPAAWDSVYDLIIDPIKRAVDWGLGKIQSIIDKINALLGRKTALEEEIESLSHHPAFLSGNYRTPEEVPGYTPPSSGSGVLNTIKEGIKRGLGVPGGLLGLAEGGIVNRPTLAMVGEAGPEAVVPLDQYNQPMVIQLQMDGRVLEEVLVNRMDRKLRLRGAR